MGNPADTDLLDPKCTLLRQRSLQMLLGKHLLQPQRSVVVCLMDMGQTAAFMKAYPVLPPRQSFSKISVEKYSLYKMQHGLSNWP